jgi:F420-dependent oxidoreductase-like protein
MSMRFGIMLEGQEGLTWDHWHRIAAQVEASGLDSLWRSDHFFSVMGAVERDSLETWASLAVLADRTRRLRFGPLVCSMTFRSPALLARMAAAVDQLAQGRLELGVGAGWYEREHQAFGIPFPSVKERMDRLEEGIEVLRRLWGPDPASFEGRYWQLRDAVCRPKPSQPNGPPLVIGGAGEVRLLRIVAQYAAEWNCYGFAPDAYRRKREVLARHCQSVGRDPETIRRSVMAGVLIGATAGDVRQRAERLQAFWPALKGVAPEGVATRLRERQWLVGTPDQIVEQAAAMGAAGVQRYMLQLFDLDDLEAIDLVARVQERMSG